MIEWFKNLDVAWQTAIFGAITAIGIAAIGGLFKLLFGRKSELSKTQAKVNQKGSENNTAAIDGCGNTANIAGRDLHIGINEDVLNAALKALNTALSMVDTDKSKNLMSELKELSDEKLSSPTDLAQEKHNNEQKLQLEKEFQLYGDLWKALVDVRSSIIITPTVDRMPKGKSPYDVYKDRYDIAVDAFNKAKNLFENNRPFYHDDVSKITIDILSQCRGYIRCVARMLSSENFDDELHDKADELLEIIPKAIDEIEKAIKVRIGLGEVPRDTKNGIYCGVFLCFAGILIAVAIISLNATSKYKMIVPDFGHTIRWPLESNSSMYIKRQKNLIFPKTLDWLSPRTIELRSDNYYQQDPNLLQALNAETSRPVPLPTECLYLESHLRSINSWSGFMLSKYFDTFSIDLSQKSETLLILNADANDIIEIGLKDTRKSETKLKFPVKSGWHGYVIPTADFRDIDKKCISLFLFAHSSTISPRQDNRFWIAYIGFR